MWSGDTSAAEDVASQLDVGMVGINETAGTEPGLPLGGVKSSGFGRELGKYGIYEFANKKLVRKLRNEVERRGRSD